MRFDRLLQILLPKNDRFYELFEESISHIEQASEEILKLAFARPEDRETIVAGIQEIEHSGDNTTHTIFHELDGTFVTPFDREDIHVLASELDDILDNIDGTARRILLYKIRSFPPDLVKLMESLNGSIKVLKQGIPLLRKMENDDELRKIIQRVNEYENEADTIFARGIADLFDKETDAIEIMKLKEVFVALETATDKAEDAADVLETVVLKNA